MSYYRLNYTRGVDVVADTVEVATHFGYIQNPAQGTYVIVNPDTGESIVDESGKEIKIRGKKNLIDYFRDNLVVWRKIYDLCEDKLKQKDDPFIVSFEKMLDIDVSEKAGVDLNSLEED